MSGNLAANAFLAVPCAACDASQMPAHLLQLAPNQSLTL